MSERVEAHFAVLRAAVDASGGEIFATMGDGVAAGFTSVDAAVRAAVTAQLQMPASASTCAWACTRARSSASATTSGAAPSTGRRASWRSATAGRSCCRTSSAALVRNGPGAGRARRPRHAPPARPRRARAPLAARPPRPPGDVPAARAAVARDENLPVQRSSLVGRDIDDRRVVETLDGFPLVTLTGVGGVGKTRLAVQCAVRCWPSDRVWFVDLAGADRPRRRRRHDRRDDRRAGRRRRRRPRSPRVLGRRAHVARARQLRARPRRRRHGRRRLLSACPELAIIATSREPLGVDGEHVVPVRPLDPADVGGGCSGGGPTPPAPTSRSTGPAHDRATSAGASTASRWPSSSSPPGGDARRAASSARSTTVGLLLGGRRRAATTGTRRCARRSSGPTACSIAAEQRLFRWLAVFPSGVELDAVRHVAAALGIEPSRGDGALASLVHKSMLAPEVHAHGVRYRMLETVRAFALDELDERRRAAAPRDCATPSGWRRSPTCRSPSRAAPRSSATPSAWSGRPTTGARPCASPTAHCAPASSPAALCGPPVAFFLLGRHDLADVVRPLLDAVRATTHAAARRALPRSSCRRRAPPTRPAAGVGRRGRRRSTSAEPTGLGGLMRWMALAWQGRLRRRRRGVRGGVARRALHQTTRDMFVGIAVLDHFSLTDATRRPPRPDRPRPRGRRPLRRRARTGSRACSARPGGSPASDPDRVAATSCAGRSTTSPTCRR